MLKMLRKLFGDVVGDESSNSDETEDEETEDERFETPPMEEVLEANQTADEL